MDIKTQFSIKAAQPEKPDMNGILMSIVGSDEDIIELLIVVQKAAPKAHYLLQTAVNRFHDVQEDLDGMDIEIDKFKSAEEMNKNKAN